MNPLPPDQLRAVAAAQRLLIGVIAANILLTLAVLAISLALGATNAGSPAAETMILTLRVLGLVTMVVQMVATFRMTKAFGSSVPWLWAIAMAIPCLSLILLLVLNHRATQALRNVGIRVGFLGARGEDVERVASAASAPPPTNPPA